MGYKTATWLLLVAIVLLSTNIYITGLSVSKGELVSAKNWSFQNASEYVYDSSVIDFGSGSLKLKINTTVTNYTNTIKYDYILIKAFYNPADKLDKINELDNNKFELNKNEILDIVFQNSLQNGDNISIYLGDGTSINLQICEPSGCTQVFGSSSYDGEEDQWVNLTLGGLATPRSIFNINTSGEIKIDYITSNVGNITGAYFDPLDKLDKLQENDNKKQNIDEDKLLNIFFNESLNNGYTINFYLEGDDDSLVSVCQLYNCSVSYGNISYVGEGWYNITLGGLSAPTDSFSLGVSEEVEVNYINATFNNVTNYSITSSSYPESGYIDTNDLEASNLKSWGIFSASHTLNGQNITYWYSINSGANWSEIILSNGSFDFSNLTDKKLRFRINLTSNTTEPPVVDFIYINYTKNMPYFADRSQITGTPGDLINITVNITNYDLVSSVTALVKYANGTIIDSVNLSLNNETKIFEGVWNSSGLKHGLYYIDSEISSDYIEGVNQRQLLSLLSSVGGSLLNDSLNFNANETLKIDSKNNTNTILEIMPSATLSNVTLSLVEYSENVRGANTKKELGRYIDIVADSQLNSNISEATITIYYSESEMQNANLNEDTLKIHYFNETSNEWEELDSVLNKTEKHLSVNVFHFSTYGIFGDNVQTSSGSGSSGGSSGGSGSSSHTLCLAGYDCTAWTQCVNGVQTRTCEKSLKPGCPIPKDSEKPAENQSCNVKTEPDVIDSQNGLAASGAECVPDVNISIGGSLDVFGNITNTGSCGIDSIRLGLSSSLEGLVEIDPIYFENIETNSTLSFSLALKSSGYAFIVSPAVSGFSIKIDSETSVYSGDILFTIIGDNSTVIEKFPISIKSDKLEKSNQPFYIVSMIFAIVIIFIAVMLLAKNGLLNKTTRKSS